MIPVDYIERLYAGWLGKVIGVRYGAPIEGWTYEQIRRVYSELTGYVVDYDDFAADDDTNGPLLFLRALEDYTISRDITPRQMGLTWLNYIPYEHGILWWGGYGNSTEHTAYLNLRAGIDAPESGSIAQNGKGVAEQIGGQIFSDAWGLICPGNPDLAAEFSEKAARVSHDGEAVYGGRFVAAAIAEAFVERDIRRVLEAALNRIPYDCEYRLMARDIFAFHDAHLGEGFRPAMEHIIANWGYDRYPGGCHVIPNSAVMIMSMLYGGGDFSRTLNICNMCGWDTDCNVGNVGTIMGVLAGLDGIDESWTKPVHDFLVSSGVVGCMNITTLPDFVRRAARIGYALSGESAGEDWRDFLYGAHLADFALPRSTCAFRLRGEGNTKEDALVHEDAEFAVGRGALKAWFNHVRPGEARYVYYGTYYHPSDFHDSRYDPAFSPIVYPGQTVSFWVKAGKGQTLRACAYCLEDHEKREITGETLSVADEWSELRLDIPPMRGGRISQIGVKLMGAGGMLLYIDRMDVSGRADYTLDFALEKLEQWPGTLHKEITEMTRLKGLWEIWDGRLRASCADFGEAYTGDVAWRDAEITCRWTPGGERGMSGFGARIQGGIRGYALVADARELVLMKNDNGYAELRRCPRPAGETLTITLRLVGNEIAVLDGEREIMRVRDATYDHGMTGLILQGGARAEYDWIKVRVLA